MTCQRRDSRSLFVSEETNEDAISSGAAGFLNTSTSTDCSGAVTRCKGEEDRSDRRLGPEVVMSLMAFDVFSKPSGLCHSLHTPVAPNTLSGLGHDYSCHEVFIIKESVMAGQSRGRGQTEEEDEVSTDSAGRRHDSQGRFASHSDDSDDQDSNSGSNGGRASRNQRGSQSRSTTERDGQGRFSSDDDDDNGNSSSTMRRQGQQSRTQGSSNHTSGESRDRDSQGRFSSDEDGGNGRGNGRGQRASGQSSSSSQGSTRLLSRAVRVLNEIETRLHELREELSQEQGSSSSPRSRSRSSSQYDDDDSDEDSEPVHGGQGRVKNPETDGRLKQNRDD